MHKLTRSLLLTGALALGGLAGCGDDVSVVQPPPPVDAVTGITISPTNVTLEVGETGVFTASVQTTGAAAKTATFSSSNTSVATIDATSGAVTAVAPGNTTITATATADANQKSSTQLTVVPVDVDVAAVVSIQSITTGALNTPVNIANTFGQVDVSINLQANDEVITTLDLLVDDVVVASQTYSAAMGAFSYTAGSAEAAADVIVLSFRTDAFDPATGVASFLNGNHVVKAVANISSSGAGTQRASNSIALVFNNNDGFYATMDNAPKNGGIKSAVSAGGVQWRQGDVLVTTVPVIYSPTVPNGATAKSVCVRTVAFGTGAKTEGAVGTCVTGPVTSTVVLAQGNAGYQSAGIDFPSVTGAVFTDGSVMAFNANLAAPPSTGGLINVGVQPAAGVVLQGFRMDNLSPAGVALTLSANADDRWINAAFNWAATVANGGATTRGNDGTGVGLALATADVYESEDRAVAGSTWVAFTANTNSIPENPADFTRDAYNARLTVKDLLGNGRTAVVNATPTPGDNFGVDVTPPSIAYMGADTTGSVNPSFLKFSEDSILNDLVVNDQGLTSATAMFGVLIRDTRSGFNATGVVGTEPLFRRIQYTNPTADICAEGGTNCAFAQVLPPIEITDPTFRVDSLNIFGTNATATATTPGYIFYETYAVDRAGNVSDTVTKSAAVDVAAPQVTGLQIPAILTGGAQLSWVPTGLDDLEVLSGQLYLNYPNVGQLAFGPTAVGFNTPFNCVWSPLGCTFGTPVGPGAPFGSAGIASPIGFLRSVAQSLADSTPPLAIAPADKPDFVSAQLYDIKRGEATLGGASADSSGLINVPLLAGLMSNGVPFSASGVGKWFVFTSGTSGGTFQARAMTATTLTNPPFPQVSFYRFNVANSQWDFLGVVTATAPSNPTLFDQGVDRFWTYSLTGVTPSLATGDNIMAIGMSAAGDGLATLTFLVP